LRALGRRRFLQAVTAAAPTLAACARSGSARRFFFTRAEWERVEAVCETLIPADRDPGGRAAGVVEFIDRQLVLHYRRYQQPYREGLAALDGLSRQLYGQGFVRIGAERQAALLGRLEGNDLPDGAWAAEAVSAPGLFELMLAHSMQGFYGDPRHGGNRDGVSWKMVGLAYPPIRGRDRYRLEGGEGASGEGRWRSRG
jgi:gluconate 2-dehydrogenase gamma chain